MYTSNIKCAITKKQIAQKLHCYVAFYTNVNEILQENNLQNLIFVYVIKTLHSN